MSNSPAGKAAILPDPHTIPATVAGAVPAPPSNLDAS
jgi:hypothetical protein